MHEGNLLFRGLKLPKINFPFRSLHSRLFPREIRAAARRINPQRRLNPT